MDFMDCANSVIRAMEKRDIETHSMYQLLTGLRQEFGRMDVEFEARLSKVVSQVQGEKGTIDITRIADIVAESATRAIHTEIKTGAQPIRQALDPDQLIQDAALAID